jgi:NADH-quinone oxidoreductase subunit A
MPGLLAYILLFLVVGAGFILVHLLVGKVVRPARPNAEKLTIYECGEPTIGSAWVQFDLRFYVVALLFVIFDVEVVFFFPWAVVFGKATALAKRTETLPALAILSAPPKESLSDLPAFVANSTGLLGSPLGQGPLLAAAAFIPDPKQTQTEATRQLLPPWAAAYMIPPQTELPAVDALSARELAWFAFWDILIFFGVLLVGFAYLWKRGDLDWVRSTLAEQVGTAGAPITPPSEQADELVGAGTAS